MEDKRYSVEEVTRLLGVTPRTLHYYEEVGLIGEVGRTDGGHRFYGEATLERLRHILRLRDVAGISLQDIAGILAADDQLAQIKLEYRSSASPDGKDRLLHQGGELLEKLVGTLDEKISKLTELRDGYRARLDTVRERLRK